MEAFRSFFKILLGEYQSGQLGQTVNLLSYDFIGSNPISPTVFSEALRRRANVLPKRSSSMRKH